MKETLAKALKEGNKSYESEPRKQWVMKDQPGQVVATIAQIMWTQDTELAISEM